MTDVSKHGNEQPRSLKQGLSNQTASSQRREKGPALTN